jgi:hypothetical protein
LFSLQQLIKSGLFEIQAPNSNGCEEGNTTLSGQKYGKENGRQMDEEESMSVNVSSPSALTLAGLHEMPMEQ